MRCQGPDAFCRKFRTFCKFCNFLGDRRRFARNIDMQSGPLYHQLSWDSHFFCFHVPLHHFLLATSLVANAAPFGMSQTLRDVLEPVYGRRPYRKRESGGRFGDIFEHPYGRALLRRVSTKVGVSRRMKRSIKQKMEEVLTPTEAVWLILNLQMPQSRCAFESMFESL